MATAHQFRELAKQCIRLAAATADDDERRLFAGMSEALTVVAALHSNAARQSRFDQGPNGRY